MGLQETNALGRAWSTSLNLNFGEYSTTYNFSLLDPWIKGDNHKTSFRTNLFLSILKNSEAKVMGRYMQLMTRIPLVLILSLQLFWKKQEGASLSLDL